MVKFMKKYFLLFITLIAILSSACNDPIFYMISKEEKILEPRIKGSPTNFADFNDKMYVASGPVLYEYDGSWRELKPGGSILSLAVTDAHLYALCIESEKRTLRRTNNGETWENILISDDNFKILAIYSANKKLFLGTSNNSSSYSIFYFNGTDPIRLRDTGARMLNGVAYDSTNYYLSTKDLIKENGGEIYCTDLTAANTNAVDKSYDIPFMGIIDINNKVLAIARNGYLYTVDNTSGVTSGASFGNDYLATGALAIWEDKDDASRKLLLAGRQDRFKATISSGFTFGYLELEIDASGTPVGSFAEPGESNGKPTTVIKGENESYRNTIGKRPVTHIYQTSVLIDSERILFASTQKDGIWSFRNRGGESKWNSEK